MPANAPNISITLPKDFTFHYTEGAEPKTPERPRLASRACSPHAYRIKRRARPTILTSDFPYAGTMQSQDYPIPTIEGPVLHDPILAPSTNGLADAADGYLSPMPARPMTLPKTPSAQLTYFGGDWDSVRHLAFGSSISRPLSSCSLITDSSDDSDLSSENGSFGGSCTSPESEAADPFYYPPVQKGRSGRPSPLADESPTVGRRRSRPIFWTAEMDKHIWTIYMRYLQDPTVTPFKMLPGSPPPLGVCHRVAREARRTWRNAKPRTRKVSDEERVGKGLRIREGSPETIRGERSGSTTPTASSQKSHAWPKSGASTRRRLRELCKRKATIAPHYQRLLQSRSPSPFASSPRSASRSTRMSSNAEHSAFATRDIQLSLATSTSSTMQPDGPLAQLTQEDANAHPRSDGWFNDPTVPWASPAPIPSSDLDQDATLPVLATHIPRLGSPFGCHTWGPSQSRPMSHPADPRAHADQVPADGPRLRSPVQLHATFPHPSAHKRRAQSQLEDDLSPGGSDLRSNILHELLGANNDGRRRVRSRGFSLGDTTLHDRLTSLFTPPHENDAGAAAGTEMLAEPDSSSPAPPSGADAIRRLGSPFAGISGRPTRVRGRHIPSASLSSYDPAEIPSIDNRLGRNDAFAGTE